MQRLWDNVIGAVLGTVLAIGVIASVVFIAISVFLLKYGLLIIAIGIGVWLGVSWIN